jgi:hypothetical protein
MIMPLNIKLCREKFLLRFANKRDGDRKKPRWCREGKSAQIILQDYAAFSGNGIERSQVDLKME